ncbi:MAG: T9SS type A sorting domain-containing protein [Saprospiraceae bacterium]|nr:T9SS type A sorting domain-containing protein [Saprospiraceae bacterium]
MRIAHFTLAVQIFFLTNLLAQPGTFDHTFSDDGIALIQAGSQSNIAWDMEVAPDGAIWLAGVINDDGFRLGLCKLTSEGSLDLGFGEGGYVAHQIEGHPSWAYGLAIQPDGKLVVAGQIDIGNNNEMLLVRLLPDTGLPDTTFGENGAVILPNTYEARDVIVDQTGRILLCGYIFSGTSARFYVARFLPNGQPDGAFGQGGAYISSYSPADYLEELMVLPDGKILAVGRTIESTFGGSFALLRLSENGVEDPTFSGDGLAEARITSCENCEFAYHLALHSDGRIVVVGTSDQVLAVARFLPDGAIDPSFGNDGVVLEPIPIASIGRGIVVQPDDKIVVAGYGWTAGVPQHFFLAIRYNEDGSRDLEFAQDGLIQEDLLQDGIADFALCAALQNDGKILIAGYSVMHFLVVRLISGLAFCEKEDEISTDQVKWLCNPVRGPFLFLQVHSCENQSISLSIYDPAGRRVETQVRQILAGPQRLEVDLGASLIPGVYFLQVHFPSGSQTIKFLVVP